MTKAWLTRSLVMGSLLGFGILPAAGQDDARRGQIRGQVVTDEHD